MFSTDHHTAAPFAVCLDCANQVFPSLTIDAGDNHREYMAQFYAALKIHSGYPGLMSGSQLHLLFEKIRCYEPAKENTVEVVLTATGKGNPQGQRITGRYYGSDTED